MPFVIGVMGIDGEKGNQKAPMMHFRQAQRKLPTLDEFKGNVVAVETSPFWDDELDALAQRKEWLYDKLERVFRKNPNITETAKEEARRQAMAEEFKPEELTKLKGVSNGGYHYLGAAKILAPIGKAFAEALVAPCVKPPQRAEMAGYLLVPHGKVDAQYNAGFSMYVAAWPLQKNYPGSDFQSGLFGTWMFAQYDGPTRKGLYSDIEGGLGWWRDTRFATETPKFIMGGVALEFSEWANGPGAGKGRDWKKPAGQYAIAQLSPWVLWPPDGLNLKQGTAGELFGYGYLPLPLIAAKKTTMGKDVPTGNQCWTLFLNTRQLQGAGHVLHPLLLVQAHRREAGAGRDVPRRQAVRTEQGGADGDAARSGVHCHRREGARPTPASHRPNSRPRQTAMRRSSTASPRTARRRSGTACRRGSTAERRHRD